MGVTPPWFFKLCLFFSLAPSLLFVNLGDEKQEIYLLWPYIMLMSSESHYIMPMSSESQYIMPMSSESHYIML